LFRPSPARLKLATAIASVLVVALIGKLYINYKEISLPGNKNSAVSTAPSVQKPLGTADTSKVVATQTNQKTSKPTSTKEAQVSNQSASSPPSLYHTSKTEGNIPLSPGSNKTEIAPNQADIVSATPIQPKGAVELEKLQKSETAHMRVISKESASFSAMTQPDSVKTGPDSDRIVYMSAPTISDVKKYTALKQEKVVQDSLTQIDALRARVNHLQELIPSISNDSILEPTYLDLAQAYFNLCSLTKDKKDLETALKTIDRFLKQYLFPDTRRQLTEIEQKLKNLQNSLE